MCCTKLFFITPLLRLYRVVTITGKWIICTLFFWFCFVFVFFVWHYVKFNLPDINVTGFESKAYIRYYSGCVSFCSKKVFLYSFIYQTNILQSQVPVQNLKTLKHTVKMNILLSLNYF